MVVASREVKEKKVISFATTARKTCTFGSTFWLRRLGFAREGDEERAVSHAASWMIDNDLFRFSL